jgi:hypothetical protein
MRGLITTVVRRHSNSRTNVLVTIRSRDQTLSASVSSVKSIADKSPLNKTKPMIAGSPSTTLDNNDTDGELLKRHEVMYPN